jgi:uncharacterized protein (TIRG00374 family)
MAGMHERNWIRRNWKLTLNIITLLALAVLIYLTRHQLAATVSDIRRVHGWALLLIIPVEVLNYHAQTKLYQRLFGIVGNRLPYRFLLRTTLELNFVNHVFPSGGVTGMSYFSLRMRSGQELTATKATLVHIMKLMLVFLSFEVLIIFGLLSLVVMGHVSNFTVMVAASLSTLLLVGTVGFAFMVGNKRRINGFFKAVTLTLNRLIRVVRPRSPETINVEKARIVVDEFHDNYQEIRSNYSKLKAPFFYALLANVTEVLAVYVVYIAFGHLVNIGAVILAYAIANFAGLVSVLPGGVGIYEALMTAVMASAGVPAGVSLPVTVMYRVLNTLLQIPPGYFLYQRALARGEEPVVQSLNSSGESLDEPE